ncbi:MAG: ECF transporter S component [Oscillospiraceae bacterium]|nr:ECF transporter S component [Oscillospiraceae bacterium]MBP1556735.1 ECF transporter S component [Oscillospiraceae bacterium]
MKSSIKTRKLTIMAMLVALSVILLYLVHFPIFPAAAFLEYDPADIPIFIGTFLFGPSAGLMITAAASIIQGFTVSASSGIIGIIMHILSTGSFVIVAGNIYRKKHTFKGALLALVCGTITMTTVMCIWNVIFTPIFMGAPRAVVINMLVPVIMPFNFIKAGGNSLITVLVYKRMSVWIHRYIDEAQG